METLTTIKYEVADQNGEYRLLDESNRIVATIQARNLDEFIRIVIAKGQRVDSNEPRAVNLVRSHFKMGGAA